MERRNERFAGNDGRAWHDIGVFVRAVRDRADVPAGRRFGNAGLLPVRFAEKETVMTHDWIAVLALSVPLLLVWKNAYMPAVAALFLVLSFIAK